MAGVAGVSEAQLVAATATLAALTPKHLEGEELSPALAALWAAGKALSSKKMGELEGECRALEARLASGKADNAAASAAVARLESEPEDPALGAALDAARAETADKAQRLARLLGGGGCDKKVLEKTKRVFVKYREAWAKRRRAALDAADMLSDAVEKKPKDFLKTLDDFETDASAGVELPPKR